MNTPKHAKCEDQPSKIFYVDLENTGPRGLNGLTRLSEKDIVYIAYTNHSCKLNLDRVQDILDTNATVNLIKMKDGFKDALDFQLSALVLINAERMDNNIEHIIVSEDHGYDFVIQQANKLGIENIDHIGIDNNYSLNYSNEDLVERLNLITELGVEQRYRRSVIYCLSESYDKLSFHNMLMSGKVNIGEEDALIIYNKLKGHLSKLLF